MIFPFQVAPCHNVKVLVILACVEIVNQMVAVTSLKVELGMVGQSIFVFNQMVTPLTKVRLMQYLP